MKFITTLMSADITHCVCFYQSRCRKTRVCKRRGARVQHGVLIQTREDSVIDCKWSHMIGELRPFVSLSQSGFCSKRSCKCIDNDNLHAL